MMKKTIATLIIGLGISTAALAFGGGQHRNHFDWDELDLTDAQENRIDDIKESFYDKSKELKQADGKRSEKREQFNQLRSSMMAEIKAVLTTEQKQQAQSLIAAKAEKRINKRLRKLSRKLDLTDEQEETLKIYMQTQLVAKQAQIKSGTLPEKGNHKKSMEEFDQQMQNILSTEQLTQWDKMKEKRAKHHSRHQDSDEDCFKNKYHYN